MTPAAKTSLTARRLMVGLCGYCTFINLYAPQAILPMLSKEFGVGAAEIATIMTVSTLAVALMAPFSGTVADVLGRKRVIVAAMLVLAAPTVMVALAPNLTEMILWRFVQGLAAPAVFVVAIAYIGEEFAPREATAAAGIYTAGASLGGFSGRFLTGILSDLFGWRFAFLTLAVLTVSGAVLVWALLPRERNFVRSAGLLTSARQMLQHFRNPRLLAIYAVGFGVMFNFILAFTFIGFRLVAPPYSMTAGMLGAIFIVYLAGAPLAPFSGWAVARFGRRNFVIGIIALWIVGIGLTLAGPLWVILLGLALCAVGGLLTQTVSTSYVAMIAHVGRSSAVGLYVTSFYLGGSFGAAIGGIAWTVGAWPACVALVAIMLVIMGLVVALRWPRTNLPAPMTPIDPI